MAAAVQQLKQEEEADQAQAEQHHKLMGTVSLVSRDMLPRVHLCVTVHLWSISSVLLLSACTPSALPGTCHVCVATLSAEAARRVEAEQERARQELLLGRLMEQLKNEEADR